MHTITLHSTHPVMPYHPNLRIKQLFGRGICVKLNNGQIWCCYVVDLQSVCHDRLICDTHRDSNNISITDHSRRVHIVAQRPIAPRQPILLLTL